MASIEKRTRNGQVRWYMRYRDPAGVQRNKTFDRKVDAERFLTTVEAAKLTGSYIDPAASRLTVGTWAQRWLEGQTHLKPSTRERYAGILREHIDPRWGTTRLADVSHSAVQTWVSEVAAARSAATTRKVHRVLSLVLAMAVKDDRLVRNPAASVSLPRVNATERMYLSHQQVHQLAGACGSHRLVVLFLAYTGVRFGEMAALRVGRLDLMRRRATIAESVTLVRGVQTWGTPKGHERREVPIPRVLVDDLAAHVAGREPGELVFTAVKGGALRAQGFPTHRPDHRGSVASSQRAASTRATTHRGVPGDRVGGEREGCPADARAQVRDHDARPVRAPFPRPARRGSRPSRRGGSRCCVPVVYPSRNRQAIGGLEKGQTPWLTRGFGVVAPTGFEPALPP